MKRYFIHRLWQGAVAIVGALVIIFVAQRVSGDPVALMLPMDAGEAEYEAMQAALGLDRPLPVQFLGFFVAALKGDFVQS